MKQIKHIALVTLSAMMIMILGCSVSNTDEDGDVADGDEDIVNPSNLSYAIVDSGQSVCFNDSSSMTCSNEGQAFAGQDAQYAGYQPKYQDNNDGTITDLVTGLMWQQDSGAKVEYDAAINAADSFTLAGHSDWRVPTIKELYSLIMFSGRDISGVDGIDTSTMIPFIDDDTFIFSYGDTSSGDRLIDSQWVTSSIYKSTVMGGQECFFGVNFADGRIKCYPTSAGKGYFAIYVRDNSEYGINDFTDSGSDIISDNATGLMWQKEDSKNGMVWEDALAYCEDLSLGNFDDWRLPNAKELQSLIDYSRSPNTTNSAAIDPIFSCSSIINEDDDTDYPFFWSSTTHANMQSGASGAYVSFGRGLGKMNGTWMDVHGAGCQRSDPKTGDPGDYPDGHGPQGDAIRIYNYVRCVRVGDVSNDYNPSVDGDEYPDGDIIDGDMPIPDGDIPVGPTSCSEESDCLEAGSCPPDATMGCTCSSTPEGDFCIPKCNSNEDCPNPPDQTLICSGESVCVPEG